MRPFGEKNTTWLFCHTKCYTRHNRGARQVCLFSSYIVPVRAWFCRTCRKVFENRQDCGRFIMSGIAFCVAEKKVKRNNRRLPLKAYCYRNSIQISWCKATASVRTYFRQQMIHRYRCTEVFQPMQLRYFIRPRGTTIILHLLNHPKRQQYPEKASRIRLHCGAIFRERHPYVRHGVPVLKRQNDGHTHV